MTKEEQSIWLASLKVGDQVAVRYGRWGAGSYTIFRIERVTSTQLVSTRQSFRPVEVRFRKSDGRVIGDDGYNRIEPVTKEVREANEREKLTTWLTLLKANSLSLPCLRAMREAHDKNGGAA